jgi:hypothetical protein
MCIRGGINLQKMLCSLPKRRRNENNLDRGLDFMVASGEYSRARLIRDERRVDVYDRKPTPCSWHNPWTWPIKPLGIEWQRF